MVQGLSPLPPRAPAQLYIDQEVPCYLVIERRGFVDDQDRLWEKGSRIYWEGAPSLGLDPINEIAEEKMRAYLERQDQLARDVAEKRGSAHASLVNAFEARRRLRELDKRNSGDTPDYQEQMPIMGAKRTGKKLARSLEEGPPMVPMMGHRGRYEVAPHQASGTSSRGLAVKGKQGFQKRDSNEGRAAVNNDDKGL